MSDTVTIIFQCPDHAEDLNVWHDVPKARLIGSIDDGIQLHCPVCETLVGVAFAPSLDDLNAEIENGEWFYNVDRDDIEPERREAPWIEDEP